MKYIVITTWNEYPFVTSKYCFSLTLLSKKKNSLTVDARLLRLRPVHRYVRAAIATAITVIPKPSCCREIPGISFGLGCADSCPGTKRKIKNRNTANRTLLRSIGQSSPRVRRQTEQNGVLNSI